MLNRVPVVFAVLFAVAMFGCASKTTQWWRVGNCLVLYDHAGIEKQVVAVGQNCEIKRDVITAQGDVK